LKEFLEVEGSQRHNAGCPKKRAKKSGWANEIQSLQGQEEEED